MTVRRPGSKRCFVMLTAASLVLASCGSDGDPVASPNATTEPTAATTAKSDDTGDTGTTDPTETAANEPRSGTGGELVIALATQPAAIDPINAPSVVEGNVANQMFDSLIWINDDGEIEPALAESWTVSDDGNVYTFTLRQGVTFHNGEEFNADAVKFTWEAGKNPENAYFDQFELASDVRVVDSYTIEIEAPEPNALFLVQVGQWPMLPPEYYTEVGFEGFAKAPVGTGAFKLVEWVQGDRIVLERFDDYWREGYPLLDRVVFRPITESSTRAAAIRTGDVDIVNRLSPTDAISLDGAPGVELVEYSNNRVYYIAFNNLTSGVGQPTENVLVRQAMNYAVDKQGIIDALFEGKGAVPTALLVSGDVGYDDAVEPYAYDPQKAKDLLAEAGFGDGFSIGMACPSDAYTNFSEVCEAVAAQLGEVGINAQLDVMESGSFWDLESTKQLPPMFGDSWSANSNEPSAYDRLFGALGGDDASYSSWSDPMIDDLLAKVLTTLDDTARAQVFTDIQLQLHDDPPFIYLYQPITIEATSDRVVDYRPRNAEDFVLWYSSVTG
ncbi:ABC transporter substrate-binding protein [Ilumatobacter sp.]|uniref:ABC transporter substrate-binding protein n=1 Tax=Ilumatobacter sp. TaxID=1967498 RepID=UPI003751B13E